MAYHRIMLKITGEALKGTQPNYDSESIMRLAQVLKQTRNEHHLQLALVLGGGNLWRGAIQSGNMQMDRVTADYVGMLATIMNALVLCDALRHLGVDALVQTAIRMSPLAAPYNRLKALDALESGKVVLFAGGTGSPFFTTDTAAALRAMEMNCDAFFKGTKVDGIYSADPMKVPDAQRFEKITYDEVIAKDLQVMDQTAFSLCRKSALPIVVFNFNEPENLLRVLNADMQKATIVY